MCCFYISIKKSAKLDPRQVANIPMHKKFNTGHHHCTAWLSQDDSFLDSFHSLFRNNVSFILAFRRKKWH